MKTRITAAALVLFAACAVSNAQTDTSIVPMTPPQEVLSAPFSSHDELQFRNPAKMFRPQTWFHYVDGNVDKEGITRDLEAVAEAGLSGIQLFHGGNFGGDWPGVTDHVYCLSEKWDDLVRHTAMEARRLGLRFTMQNCPGWAMSGGPWIQPKDAMRHLTSTRTDVSGGGAVSVALPVSADDLQDWKDYRDVAVIAFRTPLGDSVTPLIPSEVRTGGHRDEIEAMLRGETVSGFTFEPGKEHLIEVVFPKEETARSIVFSSINGFFHNFVYEPGIHVKVTAMLDDGGEKTVLDAAMPMASWQDDREITFSLDEACASRYVISIRNAHDMKISALRLLSAARKNNWEAEAGWTLRRIPRESAMPDQDAAAYVNPSSVMDLSGYMDAAGTLRWEAPEGEWTILRIGHVNTGMKNGPAPAEAVGFECDKLSVNGPDRHFDAFIGRMVDGPVKGLAGSMLMDSWECRCQTWTADMEAMFGDINGYALRSWLPALFGYVIDDQDVTSRFLNDWRSTLNTLLTENFFGRMAAHAHGKGLSISYETAAGDIFPADIMEYFKYADVPMAEFWRGEDTTFVESFNFKPIHPTASAAHIYGKPRVASEAFTSFELSWDEHLDILREAANQNCAQGITYFVLHTYTHNPKADIYAPGTSFGSPVIGTPFVRNQTWWKYMPEFTGMLSRYTYMLERGKPVADILWYLGDEIDHKPDQYGDYPYSNQFDYCNTDVLLNRIEARGGKAVTPEGLEYRVIWIPDNYRMHSATLRKLISLAESGVHVVAERPVGPASISEDDVDGFNALVDRLWSSSNVIEGKSIYEALDALGIVPDVTCRIDSMPERTTNGGRPVWMHRSVEGADWYFVAAPKYCGFKGEMSFASEGVAQIWDPVSGEIAAAASSADGRGRTSIGFDLPRCGSCFVVFRHDVTGTPYSGLQPGLVDDAASLPGYVASTEITSPWTLSFPGGWGAPEKVRLSELKSWTELGYGEEASAFSGTASYATTFRMKRQKGMAYMLDLGNVEMIAEVKVNGVAFKPLWNTPYRVDVTSALRSGKNLIEIEVTDSWYNRLAFDAGQPESQRKTWTIGGPKAGDALRPSGLIGPVKMVTVRQGRL